MTADRGEHVGTLNNKGDAHLKMSSPLSDYRTTDPQIFLNRFTDTGYGIFNSCAKSETRGSSIYQRKSSSFASMTLALRSFSSRSW